MEDRSATDGSQAPRRGALEELARDASSRKRFLTMMGGTGAAGAFALVLAACGKEEQAKPPTQPPRKQGEEKASRLGGGDIAILNFALTLEHVESDFYGQVVASDLLKGEARELVRRIEENEREHLETLTETVRELGGTPVKKPKTKFEDVIKGGPQKILKTAGTVENLGVKAYLGQAEKIHDKNVLATALAIHTVEARQAAALNKLAGNAFLGEGPLIGSIPDGAFAKPLEMDAVLAQVKPFLAA